MFYYDLLVNSPGFSNQFFSYRSPTQLTPNQIVQVPFHQQSRLGLVTSPTPRQDRRRQLKAIDQAGCRLPDELVDAASRLSQRDNLSTSELAQLLLSNASLSGPVSNWPKPAKGSKRRRTLTPAQQKIYNQIKRQPAGQPQLLLGLTGSGKTQIYIQLGQDCLESGRSVLVLVPEIGLSRQVAAELERQISHPIWHFHSQLTKARRQRIWRTLASNPTPCVVIGPRSAALLPLANLGLIVLDECHDDSFKQNQSPRYHSLHLAGLLARSHRALLLAGSATPNVDDYYRFQQAGYPIHHLADKALATAQTPKLQIVAKDRSQLPLSAAAIAAIRSSLADNAQVLIFHNRRGSRRLIRCWDCGWRASCPDCRVNLIFHDDDFVLRCHRCPVKIKPPSACPDCQQTVVYSQAGTKDLENQVNQLVSHLLPRAGVSRFDSDNRRPASLENQIDSLKDQPRQIIIGTRIIAKGLDLPRLKAVIIVDAETDLVTADYRVVEKSFQSISHLAGRVGRGHLAKTTVVIQTNQPDNPILQAAANERWLDFYRQEIIRRRQAGLPPFSSAGVISVRRSTGSGSQAAARRLQQRLAAKFPQFRWHQPLPAIAGQGHQWLIHVFAPRRSDLVAVSRQIKRTTATIDLDPTELFRGY